MPFKTLKITALLAGLALLGGCNMVVMNPSGDVAARQANLILYSTGLMLLIVLPVIFTTLFFAWRYKANRKAAYDPEWNHSTQLEVLIWTAPLMIIVALGAMTWLFTHLLDPYRPLDRIDAQRPVTAETPTITVQAIALDWKWMFIYPELGIATVNELAAPVDTPINFRLTSSTMMTAFYVPALAGMIYTMPGMETQLHAVINQEGEYEGRASHYNGPGFSNMFFQFHGLSDEGFAEWVERVRAEGRPLTRDLYMQIEQPTELEPISYYSSVEDGLWRAILNLCVDPEAICKDEVMHINMTGGGGVDGIARDRLVYDGNRSHGEAGHGPSGYATGYAGETPEEPVDGASESPGATFPAAARPPRSGAMPDEAAEGDAPHVDPDASLGEPHARDPLPTAPETDGLVPDQLND